MKGRLSDTTLAALRPEIIRPTYDRGQTEIGVVHFGPGAFHRAHQAYYFDAMLARDAGLAISAVSLRSDAVRAALGPQDGLYSLTERETKVTVRVIGSIREVLTAPADPKAVFARLADPLVRFVTATVTEKGYCLTPAGDLDLGHPDVRADLAGNGPPKTLAGWLVEGLRRRHAAGGAGLTALSCDNLSGNGGKLRRSVLQFAQARGEAELARWIEGEVGFPDSMVDSITPATDDALRAQAAERLGVADAWPVQRERFTQWVVGGDLGQDGVTFQNAGVTLTSDVAAFERAKLRLLNGAHSTLAYVGLRMGHATVAEAMSDPALADFVETLMRRDIAASLTPTAGLDVDAYITQILARFRNPAIVHHLAQIAWDGSQKLPYRLLETIAEALAAGRPVERLVIGVAAWMLFVRGRARESATITDPLAPALVAIGLACDGEASRDVARFLDLQSVFPKAVAAQPAFRQALALAYAALDADPNRAISLHLD